MLGRVTCYKCLASKSSKNQTRIFKDVSMSLLVTRQLASVPRVLLSTTPYTVGHKVTLYLSYCWSGSVNAVHSWSKSCLFVDFKHMSVGVTTTVTRFCKHIIDVHRYSVTTIYKKTPGYASRLWTVWSSRSVNLTTHLQARPELNCGAIPLFLLYTFIARTMIYINIFTFTFTGTCSTWPFPLQISNAYCNLKVTKHRLR
jgi:hypothetical protein